MMILEVSATGTKRFAARDEATNAGITGNLLDISKTKSKILGEVVVKIN